LKHLLVQLRKSFFAGLLLVLPLVVTFWILYTGFKLLVGLTSPAVREVFEQFSLKVPKGLVEVLSLLLTVFILTGLGLLGRSYLGKRTWHALESLLMRVPLAKVIYSATKQLLDSFQRQKEFQRVVLVEFPRSGCWVIGFLTSQSSGDLNTRFENQHYNVFIPTTPNPTSGYLVIVRGRDLLPLDMSVEEGITFVMSGGVASPSLKIKPRMLD
jgi:uncharacterized membrane protein